MADIMTGLPPNLQAEALALRRKQALAEALLGRSFQGIPNPQNPGRLASPISPLAPLAQAATGALAGRSGRQAEEGQAAFAGKYNQQMAEAIKQYMNQREGSPGTPAIPATGPTEFASPTSGALAGPATPGDPRGAAVSALTSGFPTLQGLGTMDLQNIQKNQLTSKDLLQLEGYDPKTKVLAAQLAQSGMPMQQILTVLGPKQDVRISEGNVVDVSEGTPKQLGYVGAEWETNPDGSPKITQVLGADGKPEPYQRNLRSGELKKLDNAPKISTTVNSQSIMKGPAAGAEKTFELAAKTVSELGDKARAAQKVTEQVQRLKAIEATGVFSNATTGVQTFMTNLAQAVGVTLSPEKIKALANSENFQSIATDMWQQVISQLGGNRNVTAPEAERIEQIIPQLRTSPQARAELYGIMNNMAERDMNRFKVANKAYTEALTAGDPSIWQRQFEQVMLPQAEGPGVIPKAVEEVTDAISGARIRPQGTRQEINGLIIEEIK